MLSATGTRAATDSVLVARRLFAAFSDGGMAAITEVLHPDVVARPSIDGAPTIRGRAAVEAWWANIADRGTEVEARPLGFEVHGGWVIVRGYLRYRDAHALAENQTFWLYEIRDGLVTRMETRSSHAAALQLATSAE